MRSSIILILVFFLFSHLSQLNAQSFDKTKMDKDLEVSENVLSSLMENSTKNRFLWRLGENIDTKFQAGYGVIYSIYDNFPMAVYGQLRNNQPNAISSSNIVIAGNRSTSGTADEVVIVETVDRNIKLKEIAKDFMLNYHNLIRQLKASDKIMVKTSLRRERNETFALFSTSGQKQPTKLFSLEATISDLAAYSSGKLSEKEMLSKIVEKEIMSGGSTEPEFEVFSAAFGRMYQSDLAQSYYMTGYPWNERTEGFGVTFYLKFYSSTQINELYNLPTFNQTNLSLIDRNIVVEMAYPEFKENLKENMLDYGHLLKNLKDSEFLVFNVKLTECIDCEIPQVIELKVKKSIIDQYRTGGLSLQAAKNKIEESILES